MEKVKKQVQEEGIKELNGGFIMRKKVFGVVCAAMLVFLAGCGGSAPGGSSAASKTAASKAAVSSAAANTAAASSGATATNAAASSAGGSSAGADGPMLGVANPWIDCGTLEEAAKISGFPMEAPDKVNGHSITLVQAVKNNMMQAFYSDKAIGVEGVKRTIIRKGVGKEDISGDYNKYEKTETVKVGNQSVIMKSTKNKVYNITWVVEGYSFAIMSDEGLSTGDATAITSIVK